MRLGIEVKHAEQQRSDLLLYYQQVLGKEVRGAAVIGERP